MSILDSDKRKVWSSDGYTIVNPHVSKIHEECFRSDQENSSPYEIQEEMNQSRPVFYEDSRAEDTAEGEYDRIGSSKLELDSLKLSMHTSKEAVCTAKHGLESGNDFPDIHGERS